MGARKYKEEPKENPAQKRTKRVDARQPEKTVKAEKTEKTVKTVKSVKTSASPGKRGRTRRRAEVKKEEPREWPGPRRAEVLQALEKFTVTGRKPEIDTITRFLLESKERALYLYGQPGSGKTHVINKLSEVLAEHGLEIYYTNLLMDTEFFQLGKGLSTSVLLVVDEFEGLKKEKRYIKQKDKLEKLWKKRKREVLPETKTVFVSNIKCHEGVHFMPYKKAEIHAILSTSLESKPIELFKRVHESTEKADLRAGLSQRISAGMRAPEKAPEVIGQYHQFIRRKLDEGITNVNVLYKAFISDMKQKDIPVIPKELFSDILEAYVNGM
ncbi:hypothetical protein NECID01_0298 [Nematocida sp. AWRm77]|nr:hypothetical protein NECID01_0298 [Nematocida sp. AWRm77]